MEKEKKWKGPQNDISDLYAVGPENHKAIGYVAMENTTPEQRDKVKDWAREKGFKVMNFRHDDWRIWMKRGHIFSGAVVVYDPKEFKRQLDEKPCMVEAFAKLDWPTWDINKLVVKIMSESVQSKTPAFDAIADLFGNKKNRGRTDYSLFDELMYRLHSLF